MKVSQNIYHTYFYIMCKVFVLETHTLKEKKTKTIKMEIQKKATSYNNTKEIQENYINSMENNRRNLWPSYITKSRKIPFCLHSMLKCINVSYKKRDVKQERKDRNQPRTVQSYLNELHVECH